MKGYTYLLALVVLFNYFIVNVLGKSDYYLVSIRKDSNDEEYDLASEKIQEEIDELVNERMNDIYDIITEHKESYANKDGKLDVKLNEIEEISNLRKKKRHEMNEEGNADKKVKLRFINKNRPNNKHSKREDVDYIPFESSLVVHICPVNNYYVVIAYLSDEIVKEINKLPNVISCNKYKKLNLNHVIRDSDGKEKDDNAKSNENTDEESSLPKYYNLEEIKEETGWSGVAVQETNNNLDLTTYHLSPISQGIYNDTSNLYDNHYYYPESAGKGIDIYVLDNALFGDLVLEEDFDTYQGTSDERTIKCDGEFYGGKFHDPHGPLECYTSEDKSGEIYHGTIVSFLAVGKTNGAAKKANLHMLAVNFTTYDILTALDYIKQKAEPHKTLVNISLGCSSSSSDEECTSTEVQEKIDELIKANIIIIVSSGNDGMDRCNTNLFEGAKNVIAINALTSRLVNVKNLNNIYNRSGSSNYGDCVVAFAPGTIRSQFVAKYRSKYGVEGSSYAAPIATGMAATLMSDQPDIKYTYETMRDTIIELSIKDEVMGMIDWKGIPRDSPNRIINNGKLSVNVPPKCSDPSGNYSCGKQCCSQFGICLDYYTPSETSYCYTQNGCQSEFGFCTTNECGEANGNRKCLDGECCSNGSCVNIQNDTSDKCFEENDCDKKYGDICFTYDISRLNEYDEKYHEKILKAACLKELNAYNKRCDFAYDIMSMKYVPLNDHIDLCNDYRNANCDEFYANPLEFLPTCKKINYEVELTPLSGVRLGAQKLYCGYKERKNVFCYENNKTLFEDEEIMSLNLNAFCEFEDCRQALLIYNDAFLRAVIAMNSGPEKEMRIKNNIEFLKSDECLNQEKSGNFNNKGEVSGKIDDSKLSKNHNGSYHTMTNISLTLMLALILSVLMI